VIVGGAVLVHHLGDLHIVQAVLCYLGEFTLFKPFNGPKPFGGLFTAEGSLGNGIELEPVTEPFVEINQHVQ